MLIIGICGGTGSGKTTVVNKILDILPENIYKSYRSVLDTKIQRGRIFKRTDNSLRVYLPVLCKYYREAELLLKFSIQKFKEAEFFTRTDMSLKISKTKAK